MPSKDSSKITRKRDLQENSIFSTTNGSASIHVASMKVS